MGNFCVLLDYRCREMFNLYVYNSILALQLGFLYWLFNSDSDGEFLVFLYYYFPDF